MGGKVDPRADECRGVTKPAMIPTMRPSKWWTLGVVCVATFMLLLDITIVNVALPAIAEDLGATFTDLQWVVDAYTLTLAALLLTAGSLADRIGRRTVFVAGLGLFVAASLLCGVASSPTMLNLARGLQGIGAAGVFACGLALLAQAFEGRERGTAFGVWGATIGAAVAIGPLVGGVLVETLGWEWIFFVNLPIGVAAVLVALRTVENSRDPEAQGIDWAGVVTFSGALFLLIYALVRGNSEGWGSPLIVGFLAGSVALLVAFYVVERRSASPMLDLRLFRKPAFGGASIAAFALSAALFAMFLYLTLYVQNMLGYEPLDAGLRFLPLTLVSFFVAPISGRIAGHVLPVRAVIGVGLLLVGVALLLMRAVTPQSEWTVLLPGFIVAGIGVGLVNPALAQTAIGVVPIRQSGAGSGINTTFRQVGIATGIAALGAVFESRIVSATERALGGGAAALDQLAQRGGGTVGEVLSSAPIAALPAPLQDAARVGFVDALDTLLLIGAIVAFVGAVLSLALVRQKDFVAPQGAPAPAAA
jgi:EmrB/QacA subfamily drug resistance transporter